MGIYLLFAVLFMLAFAVEQNRTYCILFYASVLNLILYPFTSEYSVVFEGALDLTILMAIVFWADKHRTYQTSLLLFALAVHLQFELEQAYGTSLIFDHYTNIFIGITIMQLLGAVYGGLNRFSEHLWPGNHNSRLCSGGHHFNRGKVWPKD